MYSQSVYNLSDMSLSHVSRCSPDVQPVCVQLVSYVFISCLQVQPRCTASLCTTCLICLYLMSPGAAQMYSQSVYNLPGERRSCAPELLPYHAPNLPLAKCVRSQSQDDSALSGMSRDLSGSQSQSTRGNRGRTMSDIHIGSNHTGTSSGGIVVTSGGAQDVSSGGIPSFLRPPPPPPSSLPGQTWRDQFYATTGGGGGIYESIKERTEPENSVTSSSSSSSDAESVPIPKSKRSKRSQKKPAHQVPIMGKDDLLLQQHQHHQQQVQQLYRQPYRQSNGSTLEHPTSRRDPSPTKSIASTYSVSGHQVPIPPPPLPPFRPTARPNSYPNSTVPFSTSPSLDGSQQNSEQLQSLNVRDSGILDDRSSSQGNSLEGSGLTTPDCVSISGLPTTTGTPTTTTAIRNLSGHGNAGSATNQGENQLLSKSLNMTLDPTVSSASHMPVKPGAGGILFHLDRELAVKRAGTSGQHHSEMKLPEGAPSFPGYWHRRENSQGELVIRKRSRGERDRLRQARQGWIQIFCFI